VPGRSYGLAIARRLGFSNEILSAAEDYMPRADREAGLLLHELETKDRALTDALNEAAVARSEVLRVQADLEKRELELRKREREAECRSQERTHERLSLHMKPLCLYEVDVSTGIRATGVPRIDRDFRPDFADLGCWGGPGVRDFPQPGEFPHAGTRCARAQCLELFHYLCSFRL